MNRDSFCWKLENVLNRIENFCYKSKIKIRGFMWQSRLRERVEGLPELTADEKKKCQEFWRKYPVEYDAEWCRFYKGKTGIFDPRFIPDNIYYTFIEEHFNNWKMAQSIDDKNYYSIWFPEAKQPENLVRVINGNIYDSDYKLISIDTAKNICRENEKVIIKQALNSDGGYNIFVWDINSDNIEKLDEYFKITDTRKNFVCQKFIKQNEQLSAIHSKSVNTMRLSTILLNGKVHFLAGILKMGAGNMEVDNVHWGGCTCGINSDGTLKKYGSAPNGDMITQHPSGFKFEGFKIPGFEEAKKLVCTLQTKLGHFQMASWDIAIDDTNSPVLIEVNLKYGNLDFQQWNNGPIFGDLTEEVLDDVFGTKTAKID